VSARNSPFPYTHRHVQPRKCMKTRLSALRAEYLIAGEFNIIRPLLEAEFEKHWKKRALFGASSTVYRDCGTGAEIADNLVTPVAELPETAPVAGQESGETTGPEAVSRGEHGARRCYHRCATAARRGVRRSLLGISKDTRAKKAPVAASLRCQ
jgi:hypothetical protein